MRDIKRIMRKAGHFYEPAQFIFHKLWRNEFVQMGFRVISIERLQEHPVWHIRLRCTASAQNYLLLSRPLAKPIREEEDNIDLLVLQLKKEIQRIGSQFGPKIKSDYLSVLRQGAVLRS